MRHIHSYILSYLRVILVDEQAQEEHKCQAYVEQDSADHQCTSDVYMVATRFCKTLVLCRETAYRNAARLSARR